MYEPIRVPNFVSGTKAVYVMSRVMPKVYTN